MKYFCLIIFGVLLLFCLYACGENVDVSLSPSPEIVAPSETPRPQTPSPTAAPQPSPAPSPEESFPPQPQALSYEEYFSKERRIVPYSYGAVTSNDDMYFVRLVDGVEIVHNNVMTSEILITKSGDHYVAVESKQIICLKRDATEVVTVYEAKDYIVNFKTNDVVMFILDGQTIYRLYLPDGTCEKICDVGDVLEIYPITNYEVWWREQSNNTYEEIAQELSMTRAELTRYLRGIGGNGIYAIYHYNSLTGETEKNYTNGYAFDMWEYDKGEDPQYE